MKRVGLRLCGVLLGAGIGACGCAAGQRTEADISARLQSKPLLMRGFWLDDDLKFDQAGKPIGAYRAGSFTEALVKVTQVKISGGHLHIKGQRAALGFDSSGKMETILLAKSKVFSTSPETVSIDIDGHGNSDFSSELDAIFATNPGEIVPTLPHYWQLYARKHFLGSTDPADNIDMPKRGEPQTHDPPQPDQNFNHIGAEVKPPRLLKSVDPSFSAIARQVKFSGKVSVYLWVDESGVPSHFAVVKPAGLGLDEQAIAALRQYKFAPATKDGKPVKVDLYIEVNFQIF